MLSMQGAWVPSLVGYLRSHMPSGMTKRLKKITFSQGALVPSLVGCLRSHMPSGMTKRLKKITFSFLS